MKDALSVRVLRRMRSLLVRLIQWPRIVIYRAISSGNVENNGAIFHQPVLITGPGCRETLDRHAAKPWTHIAWNTQGIAQPPGLSDECLIRLKRTTTIWER